MKIDFRVKADAEVELPYPLYEPFPHCNTTIYPDMDLHTEYFGMYRGKVRKPFPHTKINLPKVKAKLIKAGHECKSSDT